MMLPRLAAAALAAAALASAQGGPPIEFGTIDWRRDYDAARAAAVRTGKPLLLLFQEVPG